MMGISVLRGDGSPHVCFDYSDIREALRHSLGNPLVQPAEGDVCYCNEIDNSNPLPLPTVEDANAFFENCKKTYQLPSEYICLLAGNS